MLSPKQHGKGRFCKMMRKIASCLLYSLCLFTVVFSLVWMSLPRLELPPGAGQQAGQEEPASSAAPSLAAQAAPEGAAGAFYLCDEGGRVAVYRCGPDGKPAARAALTGIYVNLLPEADALRIKQGLTVPSRQALERLLEDLGG